MRAAQSRRAAHSHPVTTLRLRLGGSPKALECSAELQVLLFGEATPPAHRTARVLLRQVHRDDRPALLDWLRALPAVRHATLDNLRVRCAAGEHRLQIVGLVEPAGDGGQPTLLCIDRGRDLAADVAAPSDELHREVFEGAPDGLIVARKNDGVIVDVNARFLLMTGLQREQVIGRTDEQLGLWHDPEVRAQTYAAVARGDDIGNLEATFRLPDGRQVDALIALQIIELRGEPHAVVTIRNVTDYRDALRALAESEARFAMAFAEAPLPAFIVRRADQQLIDANQAFRQVIGPLDRLPTTAHLAQTLPSNQREALLSLCSTPSDHVALQLHSVQGTGFPAIAASRTIRFHGEDCTIVFVQDVSASEVAERRFLQAIDVNPDGALLIDLVDDRIVHTNRAFAEMCGYALSEIIGKTSLELNLWVQPADRLQFRSALDDGNTRQFKTQLRRQDGAAIDVELSASRSELAGRAWLMVNVHDKTREKEAERSVRASRERFEQLFRTAPMAIALYRVDEGRLVDVNPAFETLFGDTAAAWRGRELRAEEVWCDNDDVAQFIERMRDQGEVNEFETRLRRADGSFHALLSARPLELDGAQHLLFYIANIDARKAMEAQLRHAHKLEAIGQLAGGVAHDFNNLLGSIQGFADLLLEEPELADRPRAYTRQILATVQRAAQLTKQLSVFSRRNAPVFATVDLRTIVQDTLALFVHTVDRRLRIERDDSPTAVYVRCDAGQLENALLNLCINARDAMPNGGTLRVGTARVELDAAAIAAYGIAIAPGEYQRLRVVDTGSGIPSDVLPHIFDPFYTTKPIGRGTGLGLAAVWSMVNAHEASVAVQSELGVGTTFDLFFLPAPAPTQRNLGPATEAVERGTGHILLVDDEPDIRVLVAALLESLGYSVTTAQDGDEALALFRATADTFDLVVLDIMMPHRNGYETYRAMRELRPNVRVLLTSGYADTDALTHSLALGARGVLAKPFDTSELSREVAAALRDPP